MAKEMTAADVLAFLEAKGMSVPDELTETIANEKEDNAFHVISALLSDEVDDDEKVSVATNLVDSLFTLANTIHDTMTHEVNNVGQGKKDQTKFTVETHAGTFFVRLTRS